MRKRKWNEISAKVKGQIHVELPFGRIWEIELNSVWIYMGANGTKRINQSFGS
jgi:hypothetical protein